LSEVVTFRAKLPNVDVLWAVIARQGRVTRIADVHGTRLAAEADREWRARQVKAYASFIIGEQRPLLEYSIRPIKRAELPRTWRPLPALGILRGASL